MSGPIPLAKSKKRPRSRGSTSSIHSVSTQANLDQSFADASAVYSGQWLTGDHSQGKDSNTVSQPQEHLNADDLLLQAASHLQASTREFAMDESMSSNSLGPSVSFHQNPHDQLQQHQQHQQQQQHHADLSRQSLSADNFSANNSFVDPDSQLMDRDGNDDADSVVGAPGGALKSSSRSSANNELEMRQLFYANRHRGLQDVAEELHGNERGPNSERTRQVFAMLW